MLLSWRKYAKLYCMIVVGILLPKLGPLLFLKFPVLILQSVIVNFCLY